MTVPTKMNVQLVYRQLVAPGRLQLGIRNSNTPLRRELHSRAVISSNLQFSDRPGRTPSPALRRTISSSSFDPNAPKSGITNGTLFTVMMAIGALGIGYGMSV